MKNLKQPWFLAAMIAMLIVGSACNLINALVPKPDINEVIEEAIPLATEIADELEELLDEEALQDTVNEAMEDGAEILDEVLPDETNPEDLIPEEIDNVMDQFFTAEGDPILVETTRNMISVLDEDFIFNGYMTGTPIFIEQAYLQQTSFAPRGYLAAYLTSESEWGDGKLFVGVGNIESGERLVEIEVTNEETTQNPDAEPNLGDPAFEASRAVTIDNLAWSPNGRYLAFIGAQNGIHASVYTFDITNKEVKQLLSTEANYFSLSWSPDSQYLVAPSARSFGTGAGFDMDSVWAVNANGSGPRKLYAVSSESIDEQIIGWIDSDSVVVSSVGFLAGSRHLRVINVNSGAVEAEITAEADYFNRAAVAADGQSVAFIFAFEDLLDMVEGETLTQNGLYLWKVSSGERTRLDDLVNDSSDIEWNTQKAKYYVRAPRVENAETNVVKVFDAAGTFLEVIEADGLPSYSSDLKYAAWNQYSWTNPDQNGLYVSDAAMKNQRKLTDETVEIFLWHESKAKIFFAVQSTLYAAEAPDFVPKIVNETAMAITGLEWSYP